jgi:hypothetical protein
MAHNLMDLQVGGNSRFRINNTGDTVITGSLTVITGSAVELRVTNTGVNIGNAIADSHNVTGSFGITGSLSVAGITSLGRTTTSNAIIQRAQTPAGAYSTVLAAGTGLSDVYPFAMKDSHGAAIELRAGAPASDQYGGGILFIANGSTSALGDGNAIVFKNRTGTDTHKERLRITGAGDTIITGSLTVTGGITGSLQGTASYATAAKTITSQYICQGKLNTNQAINPGSDVVIQFVDDIDPNNWYDAGTYQFTPTVAGYYSISAGVWFDNTVDTNNQMNLQARKNGNSFALIQSPTNGVTGQSLTFNKMVYLNGSSDYVDFSAYQSTGGSVNIQQGTADGSGTWFSAFLIST